MVIAIDATQANTHERTGTEWYAFSILCHWIKTNSFPNHRVILYTRSVLLNDFPALPPNWELKILQWPPKIFWTQLRLSYELLFHRPDVLFVPSHALPLIHPKKTITTIHDIGFEVTQDVYPTKSVVRIASPVLQKLISVCIRFCTLGKYGGSELDYHKFSVRFALRHARHIFTVSHFTQQEIERIFPQHPVISVAYNGISHKEFYYPYPQERIKRLIKKNKITQPYFLSIGRVEMKKNSLQIVQTFHVYLQQHPQSNYMLIFSGSDGAGAYEVHNYINHHNLQNRVLFLGWVPQSDLPALLAGASAFLFFSEYEGFGVPIVQSLAVGTPVVANDLAVFHEIAQDTVLYCDAHNVKNAALQLNTILERTNETRDRIGRGLQISKRFNWSETASHISDTIIKILAK